MVHQVGVERVVPGHQHSERLAAGSPGPARLLPERRPRPRPAADQHRVQSDQVDPEFEGVGRGQPEQVTVQQRPFQFAPVLAQVAGPVGGDPAAEAGHRLVQRPPGGARDHLSAAPGPDEGERTHPGGDGVAEQVGGFPQGRAADGFGLADVDRVRRWRQQRRFPEGEGDPAARGRVLGHRVHRQPGQPLGGVARVTGGGRGQHEDRGPGYAVDGGRVPGGLAAQPAQYVRHVRAEHAPVGVALVDHHEREPAQERPPVAVSGQDAVVQHVGVGQYEPGVFADPLALGARGVAVVAGRAYAVEVEGGDGAQLVGGECLGRGQVEHGRARVGEQGRQRRQLVRQRLARPGAGGDDHVLAAVRQGGRLGLVLPRGDHAAPDERRPQWLRHPVRPRYGVPGAGRHPFDVGDRIVPGPGP